MLFTKHTINNITKLAIDMVYNLIYFAVGILKLARTNAIFTHNTFLYTPLLT